jgi:NAD(P)-dependent dehydrogenase (short-subunit alcohol dehydrogenase family)
MDHRVMNRTVGDLQAEVLVDFQAVMAQFLELQTQVIGAYANAQPRRRAMSTAGTLPLATEAPELRRASREQLPEDVVVPESRPVEAARAQETESAVDVDRGMFTRYTLALRERPEDGVPVSLAPGHCIAVTDDGRGIALVLAERLRREGWRVAILSTRDSSDSQADWFVSALASVEEAAATARRIVEACGPVAALLHLAPLSELDAFGEMNAATWSDRLSRETRTVFLLAQALGASLEAAAREGGAALITATSMGGGFGIGGGKPVLFPGHGGVVGFAKCLALEWPDVRVRAVDFDAAEAPESIAAHLARELWCGDTSTEIGYLNGQRVAVEVASAPGAVDASFAIPSEAVILATGGARGITAEVCLELAERYQPTFVLVGQSPLPTSVDPPDVATLTSSADIKRALMVRLRAEGARVTPVAVERAYRQLLKEREIRDGISRLSATGARTHYVQLDVRDEQAFGALIDDIYATYGRLDGVIHGAGIIEDKLVRDKSLDSFERVFQTKVLSAFVLSRKLRPESLRFLAFFTSVAGRFGNRGQGDYAAANEVVSKLAVVLQSQWPARVCAIAWAPWDKLGMVSPELRREFARRGVELLARGAGRRAFWQELQQSAGSDAEVVVGGRVAASLTAERRETLPLLKHATRDATPSAPLRFMRQLDPAVDLYLNDHRLDGRPVLPLAFATELMAEAAQAAWPDLHVIAVRNLQLLKGIVVDPAPLPVVVTVRTAARTNDDGITGVDVDISTPSLKPPARYSCVVEMASRTAELPAFKVPAWPLIPLSKPLDRAYRDWTFHGPLFQRVTAIAGIGAEAMVGTVYSASPLPVLRGVPRPEWIIDPFVFDAALQLLLIWSRARNDKTALPSRFRSFSRCAPLSDQPLTCYVAVQSVAGGHALKSNVHFVDQTGRLLAVLDTMEASCTSQLNRLTVAGLPDGSTV